MSHTQPIGVKWFWKYQIYFHDSNLLVIKTELILQTQKGGILAVNKQTGNELF